MANSHPFEWHVVMADDTAWNGYPYTLFSRLRGWNHSYYAGFDSASKAAADFNNVEKWDEHYPPHEVERCLEKYQCDIFSESTLQSLLASVKS